MKACQISSICASYFLAVSNCQAIKRRTRPGSDAACATGTSVNIPYRLCAVVADLWLDGSDHLPSSNRGDHFRA